MHGDQGFLHQILDIVVCTTQPTAVEGTQQRNERTQQGGVGDGIAVQPFQHPCFELNLACLHLRSPNDLRGTRERGYTPGARPAQRNISIAGVTAFGTAA